MSAHHAKPSAEAHAVMRDAAFRAPENHSTPAAQATTVSSVLQKRVKVYALPADKLSDLETVRAFHVFLLACGTSDSDNRHLWQNYLATLVCACFPTMKSSILQNPLFQEKILSPEETTAIVEWFDLYDTGSAPDTDAATATALFGMLDAHIIDIDLPIGRPQFDTNMADTASTEAIYGHVSIVLFLAGKNITDTNRAAVVQKRPGAIERKYFNGRIVGPLQGPLKLSNMAHTMIHTAFVSLSSLRRVVFTTVAQFNNNPGSPALEVVATTTRLMRFSGMQQAVLIDNYLSSHEEAFRIPFLMPAIQAYTASMRDLMAAPVEHRPYYKLIHGDTTRAFNRNDLLNLVVVAITEARETNPTLQQYAIPANYQLIMDKYLQALDVLAEAEE